MLFTTGASGAFAKSSDTVTFASLLQEVTVLPN
jgi:hypothetical protein